MTLAPRTAAVLLIAAATLVRLVWAAVLPISTDCAYHTLYTFHPALSYFDHPPMTMLVGKAGLAVFGGWLHPLSARFGFVLLAAGTSWVLFRWTERFFGGRAGVWAVLGFSASHYLTAIAGTWAVTDAPHFFFAALTGWRVCEAIFPRDPGKNELANWLLVGLAFGGALLSKYHTVLLPAGVVLYAAITPAARRLLWSPGPYLAVAVAALLFSPVVYWNATHEWASFKFQGGRISTGGSPFRHGGPLIWLVGPLLYLLPWIWFWLGGEFVRRVGRFRRLDGVERLLTCLAAVPLSFFFVNSCFSGQILAHWPLVGFLMLFPLAGARWADIRARLPKWGLAMGASWVAAELLLLTTVATHARTGVLPFPKGADLTDVCSGWDSVTRRLSERCDLTAPGVFLVSNQWENAAQLAFAFHGRVPVTCYHSFDARGFAFWSKPAEYVGRTGYLVLLDREDDDDPAREFGPFFSRMQKVDEFPMDRGGTPFRNVKVYRCEDQHTPYPFDFTRRN